MLETTWHIFLPATSLGLSSLISVGEVRNLHLEQVLFSMGTPPIKKSAGPFGATRLLRRGVFRFLGLTFPNWLE